MSIAKRIGDRIRQRREDLGLGQEEAARRLPGNVSGTQWSKWERGINRPRDDRLVQIAEALDADIADFVVKDPKPTSGHLFTADGEPLDSRLQKIIDEMDQLRRQRDVGLRVWLTALSAWSRGAEHELTALGVAIEAVVSGRLEDALEIVEEIRQRDD